MLAYFLYHTSGSATPIVWLVNIVIYLVIAIILWMIIKLAAAEFGVSPQIVKAIGLLLFLLLVLGLLVGCAGSGEGGAWTPQDTTATVNALNQTYRTGAQVYHDYQTGYQYPQPVTPVVAPTVIIP